MYYLIVLTLLSGNIFGNCLPIEELLKKYKIGNQSIEELHKAIPKESMTRLLSGMDVPTEIKIKYIEVIGKGGKGVTDIGYQIGAENFGKVSVNQIKEIKELAAKAYSEAKRLEKMGDLDKYGRKIMEFQYYDEVLEIIDLSKVKKLSNSIKVLLDHKVSKVDIIIKLKEKNYPIKETMEALKANNIGEEEVKKIITSLVNNG